MELEGEGDGIFYLIFGSKSEKIKIKSRIFHFSLPKWHFGSAPATVPIFSN